METSHLTWLFTTDSQVLTILATPRFAVVLLRGFTNGLTIIYDVTPSENAKYIGYTIAFNDNSGYGQVLRRVYIERWVMNIVPKNWKHAKSMFNKFLKEDVKFNQAQRENAFNTGA